MHESIARTRQRMESTWMATAIVRPIPDEEPVRIAAFSPSMSEPFEAA